MTQLSVVDQKKENLKQLRLFHKETLAEEGVSETLLIGKMAYHPTGKSELYVGFFLGEINKGHDVYIEFTDRDNVPEYLDRTLYLWKFNPYYATEYERTDEVISGNTRFLVPVSEFRIIKKYVQALPPKTAKVIEKEEPPVKPQYNIIKEDFDLPDMENDPLLSELTIKDLAALMLQKPVSNKQWLNDLIKNK